MTLYFEQILMSASVDQFVRRVKYVKTLLGISHVCVRKAPCSMLMETVKVRKIWTNLLTNKFLAPFVLAIPVVEPTKVVVPPSVSATTTSSQAPPPPMTSTVALVTPTPDARYFLIVTIPGLTVETVANNHTQCFFFLDTHVSYFSSTVLC